MTDTPTIAARRLHNQRLDGARLDRPEEVVAWLGAVQAQEYAHAKYALALRLNDPAVREPAIEQIVDSGAILRTHVMRPTWHFILPDDIRWMQALTGPRVHTQNAGRYRDLELDAETLERSTETIANALAGGNHLTRPELGAVLETAGIPTDGQRLAYMVMRAELHAIICSGPRRGKQFTYALLDERAPSAKTLPHEEALALLVRRYFTSHGPAQVNDFVWWSGLTGADTRAGLEMNRPHLVSETVAGKTYWQANAASPEVHAAPQALLLPPFDEYISYRDRSAILEPDQVFPNPNAMFNGMIALDGVIVGTWRRTFVKGGALVETRPFRPLSEAERSALADAAARYADYLEMPVELRA